MGSMRVPVTVAGHELEARVKDNVYAPDGWHLWISLWQGERMVATTGDLTEEGSGAFVVPDIDDETLADAAQRLAAMVGERVEPFTPRGRIDAGYDTLTTANDDGGFRTDAIGRPRHYCFGRRVPRWLWRALGGRLYRLSASSPPAKLWGIPVKVDPSLEPGEWRIEA